MGLEAFSRLPVLNQREPFTACRYLTFYSFSLQMVTLFICCLADLAQVRHCFASC